MTITVTTIWNINSAPSTVLNTCLIPMTALWDYYNYPHFGRGEWWVLERRNEFPKIPELVHDRGRSQIHIWHHCTGSLQAYRSSDYCFCCIVFFFKRWAYSSLSSSFYKSTFLHWLNNDIKILNRSICWQSTSIFFICWLWTARLWSLG